MQDITKLLRIPARAAKKSFRLLFRRIDDCLVLLDMANYRPLATDCPFKIGTISKGDIASLSKSVSEKKLNAFHANLESSTGYIAVDDGKILGYHWATAKQRQREGAAPFFYPIVPKNETVYMYDGFVFPDGRRKGTMRYLMAHAVEQEREKGFRFAFYTHNIQTKAMAKIAEELGFKRIGVLRYRRIFGFTRTDISALEETCKPA